MPRVFNGPFFPSVVRAFAGHGTDQLKDVAKAKECGLQSDADWQHQRNIYMALISSVQHLRYSKTGASAGGADLHGILLATCGFIVCN